MKKTMIYSIVLIFTISFAFINCSSSEDTTTVRIDLGLQDEAGSKTLSRASLSRATSIAPVPINAILIMVSGPGMTSMLNIYDDLQADVASGIIVIEVPSGADRNFLVQAGVDSTRTASAALAFEGTAIADLKSGNTVDVAVPMIVSKVKLVIPDSFNNRIVQIDDINGSGYINKNASALNLSSISITTLYPYDIDYDSRGRIFITNRNFTNEQDGIIRIDDINGTNPVIFGATAIGQTSEPKIAIAIDRIRNNVYFASNDNGIKLYSSDYDGNNLKSNFNLPQIGDIHGLALDTEGYLYIAHAPGVEGSAISKYEPDYFDSTNYGRIVVETTTNLNMSSQSDVLVKGDYVYVSNTNGGSGLMLLQFDKNLTFIKGYGEPVSTGPDTSKGMFYGPKRFIAVLNDKITIMDEYHTYPTYDKLISIDDINGTNWTTFPETGDGSAYFSFYEC